MSAGALPASSKAPSMACRHSRPAAFSLIELVVVIGIIVLLLSILLPSLSRAKEQARIAVCLANLRSIASCAAAYRQEQPNGDMPWCLPRGYSADGRRYSWGLYSEMIWGGGMPETEYTLANWPYESPLASIVAFSDTHRVEPRHRPLNRYISPSVGWNRRASSIAEDPLPFESTLPGVFRCPSDRTAYVPELGEHDPATDDVEQPTWRYWGTSFAINWYWAYYYVDEPLGKSAEEGRTPPYTDEPRGLRVLGGWADIADGYSVTPSLGAKMFRRSAVGGWESRFILFYENRLNEALEGARPRGENGGTLGKEIKRYYGWHKQPDRHSAAFLDGHAVHRYFDTRYIDGPGWTTWPNHPWLDGWAEFDLN
jgi:hypothetical protein